MSNPFAKGKGKGKEDALRLMEKDFALWDVREVGLWLDSIGLSRYRDTFFFNEIDGEMLADIDEDDLIAIPIERLGHRKKILRRINMLRGTANSSISGSSHAGSERSSDCGSEVGSVASTASQSQKVRVKCSYKNEVTAFSFSMNETFAGFKAKIKQEFGKNLSAKYRDDEGDMVVIRDDQDLTDALVCAQGSRIKLVLFSTRSKKEKKGKSKTKSSGVKSESSDADFSVLENFVDGVVVIDRRGLVQFFNASAEDMFGYDREEVVGNNVRMLMNDNDASKHNGYLRRYRREGTSRILGKGRKVLAKTKEGKHFDVWLSLSESNTSYTGIIQELNRTDQDRGSNKNALSVERDMSSEFGAFNNYPDPVIVLNSNGYIQFANMACNTAFLHEPASLLGLNANLICPAVSASSGGEDLLSDFINSKRGKAKAGDSLLVNNRRDVICYTKKNTIVAKIADFAERTFDGTSYYVVQFKSQEKDTSGSVLQAQREVIANLLIPGLIIDQGCIVQEMNAAARDIFGYNLSETLGRNIDMLLPPGEVKNNHTDWVNSFATTGKGRGPNGTSTVVGKGREVVGLSKAGELLTLKLSVTVSAEASGEKIFTGVVQLLSKSDANVMASPVLQQQIAVINQLLIPACIITQDAMVRGFNKAAQDLFGYAERELVGQDVGILIPLGDIRNMHSKFVSRYAQGNKNPAESVVVGKGRKVIGRHKEGHNVVITLSVTERKDGSLTIFTGMFT